MNKAKKELLNHIYVIIFSFIYYSYIIRIINSLSKGRMMGIGIWMIIVGLWGNIVGFTVIKSLLDDKRYKIENYIYIVLGFVLVIISFILRIF